MPKLIAHRHATQTTARTSALTRDLAKSGRDTGQRLAISTARVAAWTMVGYYTRRRAVRTVFALLVPFAILALIILPPAAIG